VGRDVLGCAQTGTGKTAAFALPILNRLGQSNVRTEPNLPLALVLAPTRELAIQIDTSFATYGRHLRLRQALVYGGVSQMHQVRSLNRGAHILVATPGRLLDLMNQGHIDLRRLEVFVLDEVDRMLDMGFLPDLRRIISRLPKQRQSLFFSATLPPKIVQLTRRLLTDPVRVDITPKSTTVEKIEQRVLFVERSRKQELLHKIVTCHDVERALVFTRTKRSANAVASKLTRRGTDAVAIHGNKSQNARQRALAAFQRKQVHVLVATDVASRGIDIEGVSHVINYDLPSEPESYVHRIGRTGRAGKGGIAISFCSNAEGADLRTIEGFIGKTLQIFGDADGSRPQRGVDQRRARSSASNRPRHAAGRGDGAATGRPTSKRRRRHGTSARQRPQSRSS